MRLSRLFRHQERESEAMGGPPARGRREWDDRYSGLARGKRNWQLAALGLLAIDGLLEEIVGLVEWPVPLLGTFEKEFLDVPQEVLISTMRGDQKYIALLDSNGKLSNKFVVIANTITEDGGKNVVA